MVDKDYANLEEIKNNTICLDDFDNNEEDDTSTVENRNLVIDKPEPTIEALVNKYNRGKIILQPDYQRKYVMKPMVASRLIESILLNIPLPVIYFAEEEDGSWSVVDGQQRLTSIISFVQGKYITDGKDFKLSGLKVLTELNRKSFKELDDAMQEKIMDTSLKSFVIKNSSSEEIKFEIFERLNTGSTPLNEDEIRNNLYRGEYINLLAELENDPVFDKLVAKPNFKNRMLYRGMILRFFAFYEKSYINYVPSMKTFCNKHLKDFRNMSKEKRAEYTKVFKETIDKVNYVFGENAFRRMKKQDDSNNTIWVKTRINMALYDVQMNGFIRYSKDQIIRHSEEIREAMYELMTTNIDFIDSIEMQTSNSDMVTRRFKMWLDKLEEIMKSEKTNPRLFPDEIKIELWNESPVCKLCNQRILNFDDAQVDHIIPYSEGGLTVKENGQLAHRYCNQHKSNKVKED